METTVSSPRGLERLLDPVVGNSIGFLRFALALVVITSHAFCLGGFGAEPLSRRSGEPLGIVGVDAFFLLSGFLVTRSFVTHRSVWRYLWHRVLRIFPAYWTCLFVVAFVFGPLIFRIEPERENVASYLASDPSPLDYVRANFALRVNQPGIDSLLSTTPYRQHLDGPLWSLIHEFRCYLVVAFLGVAGALGRGKARERIVTATIFVVLLIAVHTQALAPLAPPIDTKIFLVLALWFSAGMLFLAFSELIPLRVDLFVFAAAAYAVALCLGQQNLVGPLALGYVLLFLAARLPLRHWDRRGDFSYGLYIYGFPVQQTLAAYGVHHRGFFPYFASSVAGALLLAVLSWFAVERPALRLKRLGRRRT